MTRQVQNRQGRINHPLQATLFFSALLVFIFTVIYRMVKSESFSNAIAALVESLLIVSFFIFLGILFAYLIYFIHERIRQGSRRQQTNNMFDFSSGHEEHAGKSDPRTIEFAPDDEIESSPDSA
jgi:predicted PurR-regulated permease PerM